MKNSGKNKPINPAKKFIQQNYKLLLLIFGLTLLNIFFLCWSFSASSLTFGKTFILMLIGTFFLEIAACCLLFIAKFKNWQIPKIFLSLGFLVGGFYVFALPIGRAPDEESHFFRIYEISSGHFISEVSPDGAAHGSFGPVNVDTTIRSFSKNNTSYYEISTHLLDQPSEDQTFISTSASGYNIINYAPQVLGMTIGNLLHLPFLISAYLAKLLNLVACLLILYFSLKFIPFLKNAIFFITFLPITMQAITSLSADGLIIAAGIALVSFILYATYTLKTKFTKKQIAIMAALCLILASGKFVYALMCFLLFAIPKDRFGGQRQKLITIFALGIMIVAFTLIWLLIIPSTISATDSSAQISYILGNPFHFPAILMRTLSTYSTLYLDGTLGRYLEWFNVVLSPLYIITSFTILIIICVRARGSWTVTKSFKILSIVIFLTISLSFYAIMFITWTKVGETLIDGVQGRYFLPMLILIPLVCLPTQPVAKTKQIAPSSPNFYLYTFIIFESFYAIATIACTHL